MTNLNSTPLSEKSKTHVHKITIYVDGGCVPNPGAGGWGVVLEYNGTRKELHGGEPDSTNQRMEITAAIMALRALKSPCEVTLYTDSQYVAYTMSKGWGRKANTDLWQQLDDLVYVDFFNETGHKVTWEWVKGHDGNAGNERAHELSMLGVREAQRRSA